jgi:hypothetical protein
MWEEQKEAEERPESRSVICDAGDGGIGSGIDLFPAEDRREGFGRHGFAAE